VSDEVDPTSAITFLQEVVHRNSAAHGFWEPWDDAQWLEEFAVHLKNSAVGMATDNYNRILKIAKEHRVMLLATKLMLSVSELSEALEALRDENPVDFNEEVIDSLIRNFDLLQHVGAETTSILANKITKNSERPYKHGRAF
jgi:hypothetical protein